MQKQTGTMLRIGAATCVLVIGCASMATAASVILRKNLGDSAPTTTQSPVAPPAPPAPPADTTAPSGYSVAFTTSPPGFITAADKSNVSLVINSAEIGSTYSYTIASSGGGTPKTGTGSISSATQTISGIDLSSPNLNDGTLTVSLTLTDAANNTGAAATATATLDATAPAGYSVAFGNSPAGYVNAATKTTTSLVISNAQIGASFNYTISSSGGGTPKTGSGTISSATQTISGINLASPNLNDGTLTASITLTDTANNAGAAATGTAILDTVAPSGYFINFSNSPSGYVNAATKTAATMVIIGGEAGASYLFNVSSTGGGANKTGTGTMTGITQTLNNVDLSSPNVQDGVMTPSIILTDAAGNQGAPSNGVNTILDTVAPTLLTGTNLSPLDDATNVSAASTMIYRFSEAVTAQSGQNIQLCQGTGSCANPQSHAVTSRGNRQWRRPLCVYRVAINGI